MVPRASSLPFSLDPLIAEAKRRMRRRRLLAAVAVLLLAAGAVALTLEQRSPGGAGTVSFEYSGLSLRYPSALTRVNMCWSGPHLTPIAIWTTAQPTPKCKLSGHSDTWPPATQRLGANGISVALAAEAPPGPFANKNPEVNATLAGKPAFVSKPVYRRSAACPAAGRAEGQTITIYPDAIRPNGGNGFLWISVVICGPDLSAGNRVVDGMLASLRFGR